MGGKRSDLTGQVFGRLAVLEFSHNKHHAYWKCRCECGEVRTVRAVYLKSGHTTSCGCYNRERVTSHGMYDSPEYTIWRAMIQRCTNPNASNYSRYGGRGITVCPEWRVFENFLRDMGPRPTKDHSIDRKANSGLYCKENCRWATSKEQNNNTRGNRLISHDGETHTMSQWSEFVGVPYETLKSRIVRGWDVGRALTEPVRKQNRIGAV